MAEEEEGYHGQNLHARYGSTDTWIETPAGWRLLAPQVLALRSDPPAERTGRKPERLQAEVADYFFVAGDPRIRKVFLRDPNGQITGFVERRESWDILWRRQP